MGWTVSVGAARTSRRSAPEPLRWATIGIIALALAGCQRSAPPDHPPRTAEELVAEANRHIRTLSPAAAIALLEDPGVIFVDLREQSEIVRDGGIPGSVHVPRGLLEFHISSSQPEYREVFHSGRPLVFYCTAGSRSALAARTAMTMGVADVAHIGGGLRAWAEAGGPLTRLSR
ncbi:MAG: rhodanese-like domain-containing protein [Gemmatimonadota bacterium]